MLMSRIVVRPDDTGVDSADPEPGRLAEFTRHAAHLGGVRRDKLSRLRPRAAGLLAIT